MYGNVLVLILTGKVIASAISAKQNYSDFIFTLSKNLQIQRTQNRYKNTGRFIHNCVRQITASWTYFETSATMDFTVYYLFSAILPKSYSDFTKLDIIKIINWQEAIWDKTNKIGWFSPQMSLLCGNWVLKYFREKVLFFPWKFLLPWRKTVTNPTTTSQKVQLKERALSLLHKQRLILTHSSFISMISKWGKCFTDAIVSSPFWTLMKSHTPVAAQTLS